MPDKSPASLYEYVCAERDRAEGCLIYISFCFFCFSAPNAFGAEKQKGGVGRSCAINRELLAELQKAVVEPLVLFWW